MPTDNTTQTMSIWPRKQPSSHDGKYEDVKISHGLSSKIQEIIHLLGWKKITVIYNKEKGNLNIIMNVN